jgi:hypothetical protein
MRTPAGKECKFFYGDYFRGKSHEECRLLKPSNLSWQPRLCEQCPLPDIFMANSCENMVFTPKLTKLFFFSKPQVEVSTYCTKTNQGVKEPRIGCGHCHPALNNFVMVPDDTNDTF